MAQLAYRRYNLIGKHVQQVANEWENEKLEEVKTIDAMAHEIYSMKPENAKELLTQFSTDTAQDLFKKWVDLDKYLMVKYIDGNVKKEDANGFTDNGHGKNIPASPLQPGYTEKWKRAVVQDHGEILKVVE